MISILDIIEPMLHLVQFDTRGEDILKILVTTLKPLRHKSYLVQYLRAKCLSLIKYPDATLKSALILRSLLEKG